MEEPADEIRIKRLSAQLHDARIQQDEARDRLRAAIVHAHARGTSKYRIQRLTGLARATLDTWTRNNRP